MAQLREEISHLQLFLGSLKSCEQFAEASTYLYGARKNGHNPLREQAFASFMLESGLSSNKIYLELELFDLLSQTVGYFFPGSDIEIPALATFLKAARYFVNLNGMMCLEELLSSSECGEIEWDEYIYTPCAEKLKMYIEIHRETYGYTKAGLPEMRKLTGDIYNGLQEARYKTEPRKRLPKPLALGGVHAKRDSGNSTEVPATAIDSLSEKLIPVQSSTPTYKKPVEKADQVIQSDKPSSAKVSNEEDPALQHLVAFLKAYLHTLTTESQIIDASSYLGNSDSRKKEDNLRLQAFQIYLESPDIDQQRARQEIDFYRLVGATASSILDVSSSDYFWFKNLNELAQNWISLMVSGGLGKLGEYEEVKAALARHDSPADVLYAFMQSYERRKGFETWTFDHLQDARIKVATAWRKHQFTTATAQSNFAVPDDHDLRQALPISPKSGQAQATLSPAPERSSPGSMTSSSSITINDHFRKRSASVEADHFPIPKKSKLVGDRSRTISKYFVVLLLKCQKVAQVGDY